ncbi:2,3,4,5-tetrahydropyridine-2,6-dicarboxylate N-acetyltransferase [bioreactor metagenome]|uniref:2,3,4,5-tetrahydropyridine-2,6-dicarboxylate N-acetyltransferase n=1 Tax=bioreactor metagenome TaxID=1076179 RepID=A0A644SWQ4_9ZZZZ|nr:acyltransferase [Methanobrevibacter sp.]MEA4956264.1 acyltransferase [Methanobrevibacter sp.]
MSILTFFYEHYQNFQRKNYMKKVKKVAKIVGNDLKVNGKSYVTTNTELGNNVNFNGIKIQGKGNVIIGDNFHSGIECMLITDIHNYDNGNAIPYDEKTISKNIIIKDNVWIGNRVIILSGVTIEEGAIIQAGSVVVNNIPKYGIAGGHPAKVFKYRDKEHYEKLKNQGKFH